MTLQLDQANFEAEVLQSKQPVLVDFWAPWCGPCRMVTPLVEELAEENAETAKVGKVNVDEARTVAAAYQVQVLPTFVVFKDGKVAARLLGAQSKEKLQAALDELRN